MLKDSYRPGMGNPKLAKNQNLFKREVKEDENGKVIEIGKKKAMDIFNKKD